ncbi:MAG: tRNA adenosine(34) deaminase TadA [Bdellovibrionaceae bacterium]|nr:tRNA adenosine(34) deaminase TadA [Pseudobdellovibrionaceae bacterium]
MKTDAEWMALALKLARKAESRGEVPIGALLVRDGQILATGYNERETLPSALGHAECLAIHRANRRLGAWRLTDATLYVTLEPCLMCAGAILQARIARVVYGARDPKAGAVESLYSVLQDSRLNHCTEFTSGVLGEECGRLLTDFFRAKRRKPPSEGSGQA